jgi:integrase
LKLPPTERNLNFAANLRGQVLTEIAKGVFDYALHFPDSPRARLYSKKPAALTLVRTALEDWYKEKEHELEHSTLIGYRRIIDNVLNPVIGDDLLRDFSRLSVKKVLEALGIEVSSKRINNVLGPLRGMSAEARRDGLLDHDPLDGYKIKRRAQPAEQEEIDPFTPTEVKSILDAITGQFRNYCQFNFATGLRTSEMIGLRWPDVDLDAGTADIRRAHVMGKTKSTKTAAGRRTIKLLPAAIAALKAQQAYTRLAGAAVFHNPATGRAWDSDKQVREWNWRPALKQAEVRYRYPYQMRHTFASQALSAGENVMWVAQQMGHKDWTITARVYARWIPDVAPDAGDKLSAFLQG